MREPSVRWVNTTVAVWLFLSTLAIQHVWAGSMWNNLIVASVVFIASLAGPHGAQRWFAARGGSRPEQPAP
jgi:hypothetical protein